MSLDSIFRTAAVGLVAAAGLAGCDGCDTPELSTQPTTAQDLEGDWHVDSYAADDQGCEPTSAPSRYDRVVVELDGTGDDADLGLRICSTSRDCPDQTAPEHRLEWNDELHRAGRTFYTANLADNDPRRQLCRLLKVQSLLIPTNSSELEFTRSHYELTIPIEGQEACSAELAEDYSTQMPCHRSQTTRLVRPGDEDSTLPP